MGGGDAKLGRAKMEQVSGVGPEFLPVDPAPVHQAGSGLKNLVTGGGEGGRPQAASDVIRGTLGVASSTPAMAMIAPGAGQLIRGVAAGGAAQAVTDKAMRASGASPGWSALAGDVAGLVAGGKAAGKGRVDAPAGARPAPKPVEVPAGPRSRTISESNTAGIPMETPAPAESTAPGLARWLRWKQAGAETGSALSEYTPFVGKGLQLARQAHDIKAAPPGFPRFKEIALSGAEHIPFGPGKAVQAGRQAIKIARSFKQPAEPTAAAPTPEPRVAPTWRDASGPSPSAPPPPPPVTGIPSGVGPSTWKTSSNQSPLSFTRFSGQVGPEMPAPVEATTHPLARKMQEMQEMQMAAQGAMPEAPAPVETAVAPPPRAAAKQQRKGLQTEPWQVRKSDLVPHDEMFPRPKKVQDMSGGYTEEQINARALRNRAAETEPPDVVRHPVGSWGRDADGELMQLREYSLNDPKLVFTESPGRNQTVEKYIGWIEKGSEPPPLRAVETEKGNIKIQEGNHRAAAIRATGGNKVKVWTAVTKNRPIGQGQVMPEGVTHEAAIRNAMAEGRTIPPEILADYPNIKLQAAAEVFKPTEVSPAAVPKSAVGKVEGAPTKATAEYRAMLKKWSVDPATFPGAKPGSPWKFRRGDQVAPKSIRTFAAAEVPALAKREGLSPEDVLTKLKANWWLVRH